MSFLIRMTLRDSHRRYSLILLRNRSGLPLVYHIPRVNWTLIICPAKSASYALWKSQPYLIGKVEILHRIVMLYVVSKVQTIFCNVYSSWWHINHVFSTFLVMRTYLQTVSPLESDSKSVGPSSSLRPFVVGKPYFSIVSATLRSIATVSLRKFFLMPSPTLLIS